MAIPHGEKKSKISLFVLAQLTNVTDGRTDGQTDRHRVTAIAALCIASHGKKNVDYSFSAAGMRFYSEITFQKTQNVNALF